MAESTEKTTTTEELVLLETSDSVATVTLNRPDKLNALSGEMLDAFDHIIARLASDDSVRAVVIAGAGRAFCAGADLGGGNNPGPGGLAKRYQKSAQRQFGLWSLEKPVIAAVHGHCLGRGLELALWSDIVIAAESSKFGQPEVRDGSVVASLIPWLTTPHRAKLFMLTGDTVTAPEGAQLGLVTRMVADGEHLIEAQRLARKLSHVPPTTVSLIKRMINSTVTAGGLQAVQDMGSAFSAIAAAMSAEEKGIEHLVKIRQDEGLKAYLNARDKPFI